VPKSKRAHDNLDRLRTTREADNRAPTELPQWQHQVTQLPYAEQEHLLCAMLAQLRHVAPTAYLATLTVIESLALHEVQQRALDTQRPCR
jgi:hypothetical protein